MKENGDYRQAKEHRRIHKERTGDRSYGGDRRQKRQTRIAPWYIPNPATTGIMGIALLAWTEADVVAIGFLWVAALSLIARLAFHLERVGKD